MRLAGDRLVDGEYVPVNIEELPGGSLQGYSAALDLYLRWEGGELVFYDPATEGRTATFEDERARANAERDARLAEQARADAAEERILQLEEQLRRNESQ